MREMCVASMAPGLPITRAMSIQRTRNFAERILFNAPRICPSRALRWVFCKGSAIVTCELTSGDNCFELATVPPYPSGAKSLEIFSQVSDAFHRQAEIEAALVRDGWTLGYHESILA